LRFGPLHILGGRGEFSFFENKHGVVCCGFLLVGKILCLKPKQTFKKFKMARDKLQEGSSDG